MRKQSKIRVFIDAMPLSGARSSGVGHNLYGLISALSSDAKFLEHHSLVLVTTVRGYQYLRQHNFQNVAYVKLPLLSRIMNRLPGTPLMPYMDMLLGTGVYLFTNFRRWPLLKSKSITTVHDLGYMLYPEYLTDRHRSFLEANVSRWAQGSDIVLAVSENARRELIEHLTLDAKRVRVVPNGVDLSKFVKRGEAEVAEMRARYSLPEHYILYLGNIEPRKNLVRLVRAYRELPKDITDKHPLVLVGGAGWLSEDILAEVERAKKEGYQIVRPEKYVVDADLPALHSGADLLVHPAVYEGFGISPLEAMACGTPVVAANNSSLPEVVGEAGILVDALDEKSLTAAMERVLTDKPLRQKLVEEGYKQAKKYQWTSAADKLAHIIDELAEAGSFKTSKMTGDS